MRALATLLIMISLIVLFSTLMQRVLNRDFKYHIMGKNKRQIRGTLDRGVNPVHRKSFLREWERKKS